jgi:hypothetical protein
MARERPRLGPGAIVQSLFRAVALDIDSNFSGVRFRTPDRETTIDTLRLIMVSD